MHLPVVRLSLIHHSRDDMAAAQMMLASEPIIVDVTGCDDI